MRVFTLCAILVILFAAGAPTFADEPPPDVPITETLGTLCHLRDWGDAPDPTYPTLAAHNAAYHWLDAVASSPFMGATVDAEPDGQPSVSANGDGADEDGVTFGSLVPGETISVTVDMRASPKGCYLNAWMDWDRDGWWQADEQVFAGLWLDKGTIHPLAVTIPEEAEALCYVRVRCSSTKALQPTGGANDGEVEDYLLEVAPTAVTLVGLDAEAGDKAVNCWLPVAVLVAGFLAGVGIASLLRGAK